MSLVERDPSLIFHNPALLGAEMDQMVNLNYLNYISDINVGSALFTKAYKEKGAWGVGASFFSQGKIRGMSEEGLPTGDFTAKDISVNGFFSYDLSERWPKDAGGKNEQPAFLTLVMDTNAEADMLCSMLRAYGIPVLRKYEGEGSFGKIVLGMPGSGTWLYVPSSMLEDAKNLIRPIDEIPEQEDMQ